MTPAAFLAAVLPPPGYGHYCVVELSSKKKTHAFVDTIEEAAEQAVKFDKQKFNTYFALATFENTESREAQNARWVKSFFVDIDCGGDHRFASPRDGAVALNAFIGATNLVQLPSPIVDVSGGGIHAYWPLTEPVSIERWKPVAERFKQLAKERDFPIDFTVTADAARILRMPGTTNWKLPDNPRPCVIKFDGGGCMTLDAFATAVGFNNAPQREAQPSLLMIKGERPKITDNASGVKLLQNSATYFRKLLAQVNNDTGCKQIRYYADHAREDGIEPLWRAVLSIAKPCADGEQAAKILSSMHPYDEERMHAKLRAIKGPYPCTKFNTENPGVCITCPSWGKIINPLALSRETLLDSSEKQVEVTIEAPDVPPVKVTINRPPPPHGYAYGMNGGVYAAEKATDVDAPPVMKMIVPYDMFVVNLMNQDTTHHVHFVAMRPNGAQNITMPMRLTVTRDDMCKELARHNIMATNDDKLFRYLRACITHASENQMPLNVPAQYGWQPDGSFVYDGKILSPGSEITTPLPGLDNITRVTKPAGTIEGWRKTVELLIRYKLNDILAIMTIGFGAPLMRFTSFNGLTFHLGSSESGTGKSLALQMAASIWGHPTLYMVGKDTSGVAMQQRLGLLNSLPLICDEITQKNRQNFEWFPGFVFDMTDGKGKERMDGNVNRERTNTTYWSSLALVSSNTHVMDYLSSRKHSSQGEIMRLLELKMSKELTPPADLYEAIKEGLPHNYGTAGILFSRWLANNAELAQSVVRRIENDLKDKLQHAPNERFWIGGVAACLAGAVLAGKGYANIIDLPLRSIHKVFADMIESARHVAKTSKRSADDVLNAYIREYYGKFIIVKKSDDGVQTSYGDRREVEEGVLRSDVCGRVEHGFKVGRTVFFIEEQLLKRFCASMSFGYTDFKVMMMTQYGAFATKKDMLSGTRGPAMNVNVLKISVPSTGDGIVAATEGTVPLE